MEVDGSCQQCTYGVRHCGPGVIRRMPQAAVLLVLNANTGKEIFRLPTDTGANDLFYDANLHRIYVITGAGLVDVYAIDAGKRLSSLGGISDRAGREDRIICVRTKSFICRNSRCIG